MNKTEEQRERFAALVTEHSRSMYRAARALLPGDADAQDAVGEAVLLAWQSFERLRKPEAARSWLLKITVNCAYSHLRRQSRVVYLEQPEGAAPEDRGEAESLWEAVLRLPEDQRLAVTLYYYEDMPVAQIAHTLGIPQGTVKSRLSRGRERLRQLLREEEQYGFQEQ